MFDFAAPESRDVSEAVSTLAHLARFIVADISDPRSIPHELAIVVRALPSVTIVPLIERGQVPYGMFAHIQRYEWVKPLIEYDPDVDPRQLVAGILAAAGYSDLRTAQGSR